MGGILTTFVIVIGIIVFASIINEKKLHFPHDIALLLVSFLLGALIFALNNIEALPYMNKIFHVIENVKLDSFVLECALGFIMFASASKIHLTKFVKNLLPIRSVVSSDDFCFFCSIWRAIFSNKFNSRIKCWNMAFLYFTVRY